MEIVAEKFNMSGRFIIIDSNTSNDEANCRLDDYIEMDIFVHVCLIPAVTIIVILSFLAKRQKKYVDVCWGRPGMLSPVNFMENYSNRWSYAVAFGATTSMLVALFWGTYSTYFGSNIQSLWAKVLVSLLSVAEIGINFYPFFICLASPYKLVGSSLGFLYAGLWFSVQLYNIIVCPRPPTALFDFQSLVIQLPVLLCLLFLLFRYAQRFCLTIRNWYYDLKDQDEDEEDDTKILKEHQILHVRRLLQKPNPAADTSEFEGLSKWRQRLYKFYTPDPAFRYSPRYICTMAVLLLCLYQIVILFIYVVVLLFQDLQQWIDSLILEIGPHLNGTEQEQFNNTMSAMHRLVSISQDCWYAACAFTTLIEFMYLVHVTMCFRKHMKRAWRGQRLFVTVKRPKSAVTVGNGLKYSGYQIAYFLWSYLVIQIMLWIVFILFTYLLIVPFVDQYFTALLSIIQVLVPYLLIAAFVLYGQTLLAKYCFVQDRIEPEDEDKPLALKNRRLYHNFSYFLFFYNVAVGLIVCLLRIFVGMFLGILFLGRIDRPILMRGYEGMDKGFSAYVGMVLVENSHCHPVLVCFCQLLMNDIEKQRRYKAGGGYGTLSKRGTLNKRGTGGSRWSQSRGTYKYRRSYTEEGDPALSLPYKRATFRWQVAYTLLNNPCLIELRKKEKAAEFDLSVHGSYVNPHSQAVRSRTSRYRRAGEDARANGEVSKSVFYDNEDDVEEEERRLRKSQFYVTFASDLEEEIPEEGVQESQEIERRDSEYEREGVDVQQGLDSDPNQITLSVHDSADAENDSRSISDSYSDSGGYSENGVNLHQVSSFGATRQYQSEENLQMQSRHTDTESPTSSQRTSHHSDADIPQAVVAHDRLHLAEVPPSRNVQESGV